MKPLRCAALLFLLQLRRFHVTLGLLQPGQAKVRPRQNSSIVYLSTSCAKAFCFLHNLSTRIRQYLVSNILSDQCHCTFTLSKYQLRTGALHCTFCTVGLYFVRKTSKVGESEVVLYNGGS
jgi:hypothetical protein